MLEKVNLQKGKEEKELQKMKSEKLNIAQSQLSTVRKPHHLLSIYMCCLCGTVADERV